MHRSMGDYYHRGYYVRDYNVRGYYVQGHYVQGEQGIEMAGSRLTFKHTVNFLFLKTKLLQD
jgi:hypothetical protein